MHIMPYFGAILYFGKSKSNNEVELNDTRKQNKFFSCTEN